MLAFQDYSSDSEDETTNTPTTANKSSTKNLPSTNVIEDESTHEDLMVLLQQARQLTDKHDENPIETTTDNSEKVKQGSTLSFFDRVKQLQMEDTKKETSSTTTISAPAKFSILNTSSTETDDPSKVSLNQPKTIIQSLEPKKLQKLSSQAGYKIPNDIKVIEIDANELMVLSAVEQQAVDLDKAAKSMVGRKMVLKAQVWDAEQGQEVAVTDTTKKASRKRSHHITQLAEQAISFQQQSAMKLAQSQLRTGFNADNKRQKY